MAAFSTGSQVTIQLDEYDTVTIAGSARLLITVQNRPQFETTTQGNATIGPFGMVTTVVIVGLSQGTYTQQPSLVAVPVVMVDMTSAQVLAPTAAQLAATNVLYQLNSAPYTIYQSNGTSLQAVGAGGSTPLVNDLTTGGTTAALTAQQGVVLKNSVDSLTTTVAGKVASITAGSNITIGGTATNPIINSTGGGSGTWAGLSDKATAPIDTDNTALATALAAKAPLVGPVFTGIPQAPTAAAANNTTQIATTAHVFAERSNASTLTNKTISGASNTLTNLPASGISGVIPIANLATGTPTGSKFIRDDGVLAVLSGGGDALIANPLSQFAATTSAQLRGVLSDETGTGAAVFAGGNIGAATATSLNKVAITAPATGSTLTIADGKTATVSNTLSFTGTDGSSANFGAGGTVAYKGTDLSQFAATSSAVLAALLTDETGTGPNVFGTSPIITTPTFTGVVTTSGGQILTPAPMAANVIDITSSANTKSVTGSVTYTFSATPSTTGQSWGLELNVTTAATVTFPSFISALAQGTTRTTVFFPLGKWLLFFKYDGTNTYLYGEPGSINNYSGTTAPGTGNDNTQGYAVGSIWVDTTGHRTYIAETVGTGTASWQQLGGSVTGLTVAQGGTGVATLTAYAPVFGGTTGTGAVQSGTAGTSGQVLTSNGAGVLPTFQSLPVTPAIVIDADITGTTYTFVAGDLGKEKRFTNASGCTATIPASLGAGWNCLWTKSAAAGSLTFAASGTTIIAANGSGSLVASVGTAGAIVAEATDTYKITGQLGTVGLGDMVLATVQTVTGAKTFGSAGAVSKLKLAGNTSGSVTLDAPAVAGTAVVTLPGVTSTLATLAGTEALTNKTYNGNSWTAGTGTLAIGAGKTATINNTVTLAGTDGTTITLPPTTSTLAQNTQSFGLAFTIPTVANGDSTIVLRAPFAGTITETSTQASSGTCTVTWKIAAATLGATNSVSTTLVNQAQTTGNTFAVNDKIFLTVSSNSTCLNLDAGIKYTRVLA